MKKIMLALGLLFLGSSVKAEEKILFDVASVKVILPFSQVNAVYLFDTISKSSLVGGETPIIRWQKLQFTAGAVTTLRGTGTPFVGVNLALENPARNFVPLSDLNLGVFAGRDFNENEYLAGFKASLPIFQ